MADRKQPNPDLDSNKDETMGRITAVGSIAGVTLACSLLAFTGCGGGGATVTPTPPTPTPVGPASGSEFLYTFTFLGDIRVATLNTTTGGISSIMDATPHQDPHLGASLGETFTAVVLGKYFYVSGFDQWVGSGAVYGFTITGAHGELTILPSSPYDDNDVINFPTGLTLDGQDKYLYLSGGGTILTYQIDKDTGILTDTGEEFTNGTETLAVKGGDSAGRYVYALGVGGGSYNIHVLSVGFAGVLTDVSGSPLSVYSPPPGVNVIPQLLISPDGNYLYLSIRASSGSYPITPMTSIYSFSINSATGALTAVPGSPFTLGSSPFSSSGEITISPNGQFMYVPEIAQQSANTSMSVYAIDPAHGTFGLAPVSSVTGTGKFGNLNLIDTSGQVLISRDSRSADLGYWSYLVDGSTGSLSLAAGSPFNISDPNSSNVYGGSAIIRIP
jgi:6-phosphogluconolactonase